MEFARGGKADMISRRSRQSKVERKLVHGRLQGADSVHVTHVLQACRRKVEMLTSAMPCRANQNRP